MKKKPIDLLTHTRFDVIIKYMYAKSILEGYNTTIFQNIYKEHLRIWNNFKEYDKPEKNTFEAFDNVFKQLIEEIKCNGFNDTISKIPVVFEKYILNGSHRLASALATDKDVYTTEGVVGRDGQLDCGYKFFENLGLNPDYADRTAIEYAKLKKNTFIVFIFPSANGKIDEVINILNKNGKIVYSKNVPLNENGSFNLIKELYLNESWGGTFDTNFSGFRHKQHLCYPTYQPTSVFLLEFDNLETSVKVKEIIRSLFNIGKHSVHINDTHEETIRLAKTVFNKNSVHFLNNKKTVNYKTFDNTLDNFKKQVEKLNLDIDDYCICGSSPLSAYGLREGNDLDYLHSKPIKITDNSGLLNSHNEYSKSFYTLERDEIIYNPNNHFFYKGVKFATLEVIKGLKENRKEQKDKIDLELIKSIYD
jgi:hypothetical protein